MKFRISISQEQLEWILTNPDCPADLKKQLRVHQLKISEGLVQPAYEIKPREKKDLSLDTKYLMACSYLKRDMPIPVDLIPAYNEYRYLNDLMESEEASVYETEQGF